MAEVEELLAQAADGSEEAIEQLKTLLAEKDKEARLARLELKLTKDKDLRERYPRAIRAYERGRLKISEDMTEEDLVRVLGDKEEELAELGVPLREASEEPQMQAKSEPESTTAPESASAPDRAQALAGAFGASGPAGQARDLATEFEEALRGSTQHDRARAWRILVELQKPEHRHQIERIVEKLQAPPIISTFS